MSDPKLKQFLEELAEGTTVTVKRTDGSEITGTYKGTDGDQVHLADVDDVGLAEVDTVLMDVVSEGPE